MSRLQTLNIRICLLLATVLITGGINAQDFYKFISQADSLHNAGDYSEADKIYDIAFQNREDAPYGFYYNAAFNNALAKNYEKSIAQFKYTIEKGLIDFESLLEDSDLSELREQDEWRIVSTLIQEREEQLNRPLISKLEWLREKDQLFRQLAACKEQLSNKQTEIFEQVSLQYDSLNVQEVTEFINANGEWIGTDLVGYEGNLTIWLIIQHADISIQERYIPLLEKSVMLKQSRGEHLAMLQDRILMKKGRKQKYGTQIKRNKETGDFYVYAIENVGELHSLRKSIGLAPINEYLKRWKITIENNYVDEIK